MAAQDSAYPLVAPSEVDVPAIEKELEEIWRCCAEAEGGNAVVRMAAFTLIYAVKSSHDGGMVSDMLVELTLRHPVRLILLRFEEEAPSHPLRAWVTVYCHRPAATAAPVCSDFITLESTGNDPSAVVSTLLSLLLSGMPTVLAWDSSLAPDHPVLLKLGPELERVIASVIPPCGPASSLSTLFKLSDALGEKPVLTDMAEEFVRTWQTAVANLFDIQAAMVPAIREVRIGFGGSKIPAEMLILAAWISVVLKWKTKRITLHGHVPAILFDSDHMISFVAQPDTAAREYVDFVTASPDGEKILRCEEPTGENRLLELLHLQLQIWGRDPQRTESLHRARLWLKELLFS